MTTCFLAPDPIQSTQFIPGGNTPANGGQLFFYAAGSSTKQTVYKDNAAAVSWTNPIVLDSGGNLPSGGEVWFPQGQTFKVIFAPSNDTDPPASPYWTKDNLAGTNDVSAQTGVEWISGPTPTFVSTTQFTLAGDQTATFTVGRRIKTTNTAGTVYSTITSSSFSVNTTTVNVAHDGSGVLDSGLSAVSYGVFDPANPSISASEVNRKGNAVISAGNGTTNIWAAPGDYVHITGTNAIYFFSTAPYAGAMKQLIFDGALNLMSSAALNMPNVTTAANDRAVVRADTVSTYIMTNFMRAASAPATQGGAETFTNKVINFGSNTVSTTVSQLNAAISDGDVGLIKLDSGTTTAALNLDINVKQYAPTYRNFVVVIDDYRPSSSNTNVFLQISSDNGSTYATGDYEYGVRGTVMGVGTFDVNAAASAAIVPNNTGAGQKFSGAAGAKGHMVVELFDIQNGSGFPFIFTKAIYRSTNPSNVVAYGGGARASSATLDRLRIAPENSTASFNWALYGRV